MKEDKRNKGVYEGNFKWIFSRTGEKQNWFWLQCDSWEPLIFVVALDGIH